MATRDMEGCEPGWKETWDHSWSEIRTKTSRAFRENFAIERKSTPRPGRTKYTFRPCGHLVPVGEACTECAR